MLRKQVFNLPMEAIRAIVAIAETGSMSRAAERLNLSQPAISSQVKRLQGIIGGELFSRTPNGSVPTKLGELALKQSRRILDANDQLLRLGGRDGYVVRRLGLSQLFAAAIYKAFGKEGLSDLFVSVEHSSEIRRGLIEGYIDVGCFFLYDAQDIEELIVHEYQFETTWIKAPDFVLSPGAPIPIVTLPEDSWLIKPLDRSGIAYRIVLRSSDSEARVSAVKAGLGLSAMPNVLVPPGVVHSKDYYLPQLAPARAAICLREGLIDKDAKELAGKLSAFLASLDGNSVRQLPRPRPTSASEN